MIDNPIEVDDDGDEPKGFRSTTAKEAQYWADLSAPCKLKKDYVKSTSSMEEQSYPDYKNIQHTKNS